MQCIQCLGLAGWETNAAVHMQAGSRNTCRAAWQCLSCWCAARMPLPLLSTRVGLLCTSEWHCRLAHHRHMGALTSTVLVCVPVHSFAVCTGLPSRFQALCDRLGPSARLTTITRAAPAWEDTLPHMSQSEYMYIALVFWVVWAVHWVTCCVLLSCIISGYARTL